MPVSQPKLYMAFFASLLSRRIKSSIHAFALALTIPMGIFVQTPNTSLPDIAVPTTGLPPSSSPNAIYPKGLC